MNVKAIESGYARAIIAFVTVVLLSVIVAGCGGGGGEGGGGGDKEPPGITYSGNKDQAVIDATNAAMLVTNVIGGSDPSAAVFGKSFSQETPIETAIPARQLVRYLRNTILRRQTHK